jgi:uncharacterized membrane protein
VRISEQIEVAAPREVVWQMITEPTRVLHFMAALTRWEVVGDQKQGLGARYRMLMRVGSAEIGGLVEVVEWKPESDFAWTSVTGLDQRARWRLREQPHQRTRVEFRISYGVAGSGIGGWIAEHVAASAVRTNLRRSLQQLKRQVEQQQLRALAAERRAARRAA